jgi:hypothetical protein
VGSLAVSEGALTFTFFPQLLVTDFQPALMLTPADPGPTPVPPSLLLVLTGVAAIGLYQFARSRARTWFGFP